MQFTERNNAHSGLEVLGQRAAEIAHELNNPLTAIANYAKVGGKLAKDLEDCKKYARLYEVFERIEAEALRCGELTNSVLTLARPTHIVECSLSAVIDRTLELLQAACKSRRSVINVENCDDIRIAMSPCKMQQIFLNLIVNALESSERSVDIHISGEYLTDEKTFKLRIADNGDGIPKQIRETIFQPFFSTKQETNKNNSGTGLGLAIVQRILIESGGNICLATSAENESTAFELTLPLHKSNNESQITNIAS